MAVDWDDRDFLARVEAGAFAGVVGAIGHVDQEATRLILRTPKTGREYSRRGVVHKASAPGEAPASDTGTLIQSKTVDTDLGTISARLTFRTDYALALEVGTKNMEPRPYARQALLNVRDLIISTISREITSAIAT